MVESIPGEINLIGYGSVAGKRKWLIIPGLSLCRIELLREQISGKIIKIARYKGTLEGFFRRMNRIVSARMLAETKYSGISSPVYAVGYAPCATGFSR